MKIIKKTTNILSKKSIRNSVWIVGEKIYQTAINFILTILTSRYLGPANYGILNYGATLTNLFLVIMKLGLDNIMTNELIKDRKNEGAILGTSIYMRALSSIISIIVMAILVFILQANSPLIIITSFLQSLALIFQIINILDYWFQSNFQSKYVSIAKAIAYTVMAIYKFWLLATNKSVIWFALSTIIDYIFITIFLLIFYKRKGGQKFCIDKKIGKNLLSQSHHFIISGIMVLIYTQIDKIMIGQILDETQLGLYSAALAVCSLCTFIPDAILTSARATVYNAKKNGQNYLKRLKQTYSIIFWTCAAMALFITLFAPFVVPLIYGEAYVESVPTLQLLIWYIPISQLGLARGIWIVSESKNKYSKKYTAWGVIMNIVLNAIMIPILGILGATIATIITELFTCFITPLFYKGTRVHTKYVLQALIFNFKEPK